MTWKIKATLTKKGDKRITLDFAEAADSVAEAIMRAATSKAAGPGQVGLKSLRKDGDLRGVVEKASRG